VSAAENNVVAFPGEGDELPLIPEGVYRLAFKRYKVARRFDRDVLELEFAVTDYGEHFGKKLVRYYPVRASEKRRNFTARPRSDFAREYAHVFGRRPRFGTASLEIFGKHIIVGRVGTTTTDHRQKRLPEAAHYSVVRELLSKEGG
jgi:hypothetical protein